MHPLRPCAIGARPMAAMAAPRRPHGSDAAVAAAPSHSSPNVRLQSRNAYPPSPLLQHACSLLARANGFSPLRCIRESSLQCALVDVLPDEPDAELYFSLDRDQYIVLNVRPASSAATSWPRTRAGRCRPVRLHRWLARAGRGEVARHRVCHNPRCAAAAHLLRGSQGENMADRSMHGRWASARATRAMRADSAVRPTRACADEGVARRLEAGAAIPPRLSARARRPLTAPASAYSPLRSSCGRLRLNVRSRGSTFGRQPLVAPPGGAPAPPHSAGLLPRQRQLRQTRLLHCEAAQRPSIVAIVPSFAVPRFADLYKCPKHVWASCLDVWCVPYLASHCIIDMAHAYLTCRLS